MAKIAHVITGLKDGGAEAVLYRLCVTDKSNTHIVISLMNEGKYGSMLREKGIKVYSLGMPRRGFAPYRMWRLWCILREEAPGVVQTWMYHADLIGGLVSRFAGIQKIFWGVHHSRLEKGKSPFSTICVARICALLSYIIPKKIIFCSASGAAVHKSMGYCKQKGIVIHNGYDFDQFHPDPSLREILRFGWGIDEGIPLLGMIARFDKQKDHNNLLDSLSIVKKMGIDFRCVLVGSGIVNENDELVSNIRRYALEKRILLLGVREDIPGIMNALDLHVLSSSTEAFPNVLAEAMACGVPCVSTDVGDARLILGETGWVAPPSDPEALSNCILEAIKCWEDREKWRQRKSIVYDRVLERFEISDMVRKYNNEWWGIEHF